MVIKMYTELYDITEVKRGDIFYLKPTTQSTGSIQHGGRPVVVLQNNIGNKNSTTTIVAAITTKCKPRLPVHAQIDLCDDSIRDQRLVGSIILFEQIFTVNKSDLIKKIGRANLWDPDTKAALLTSLDLQ